MHQAVIIHLRHFSAMGAGVRINYMGSHWRLLRTGHVIFNGKEYPNVDAYAAEMLTPQSVRSFFAKSK